MVGNTVMSKRDKQQYGAMDDMRPQASQGATLEPQEAGQGSFPVSTDDVYDAIVDEVDGKIRKRRRWTVVFVIALIVFLASITALGVLAFSYYQGQAKYGVVADVADVSGLDEANDRAFEGEALSPERIHVDWDALLAANPDTVAWLYMPNTAINYPVVKTVDNDYYLTHDFDGEAGWLANYGAIFMDYRNMADWSDSGYFIYGHHMRDGSMFADIVGLENQARFDEARTIYLLSPRGNFRLRTFALVHCAPDDALVTTEFVSGTEMRDYIQDKMDRSLVTCNDAIPADQMGKVFGFATCDSESWGRYILYAYVQDASDEDLKGEIGISTGKDGATGFVEEVELQDVSDKGSEASEDKKEQKNE